MTILHLTDLHIAANTIAEIHFRTRALSQALKAIPSAWSPTILAVTGDLCRNGSEEEFLWGEVYLRNLLLSLDLPPQRAILCPGNHDAQYPEGHADFTRFYSLCDAIGVHSRQAIMDDRAFAVINTCHETTEIWYDRASLPPKEAMAFPKNSILLLHHPPQLIREQRLLQRITRSAALLLSGHCHVDRPACTRYGAARSVNGVALLSHIPGSPYGCQIIRIESDGFVRIAALTAQPKAEPNFVFEEYPSHVSC